MKFLIYIALTLSLIGCSSDSSRKNNSKAYFSDDGKLKILSTTAMINDIVERIAGDSADTMTLIAGNLDPHSYQLVKGDDEKLSHASIIFANGLGLEHGASLQNYLNNSKKAVLLGNLVQEKFSGSILHVNGQIDPHLWMDLSLFAETIPFIVKSLSDIDPKQKELYQERGNKFLKELKDLHLKIREELQSIPKEKRYLVTSHDAFNYFAKSYLAEDNELLTGEWKERFDAPEGLAPDSQLSLGDIQHIIDHLFKYKIEVIFPESNVSQDSILKIQNAAKLLNFQITIAKEPLYGDAMGAFGSDGDSYPKMLQHNANVIKKYLLRGN